MGWSLWTPVHRKWNGNLFQGKNGIASHTKERSWTRDRLNSLAVFLWHCPEGKALLSLDAKPFSDEAGENLLPALLSWGGGWREGRSKCPILGAVGQPETREDEHFPCQFVFPELQRGHTVPPFSPLDFLCPSFQTDFL